jgi:hypothetical protein
MLAVPCANRAQFDALRAAPVFVHHRDVLNRVVNTRADDDVISLDGFCWACDRPSVFHLNRKPMFRSESTVPNWRDGLYCERCGMSNRVRSMCWFTDDALQGCQQPMIYVTERETAFYEWLEGRYGDGAVGSEFLGDDVAPGTVANGVRHENVEALSFADATFDVIVSMDVLEHVNEPRRAIHQLRRVLKPGGVLLLSVPFFSDTATNVRRAEMRAGTIVHHEPATYHGYPPPGKGWLVYWDYGWELVDDLRVEFESVELVLYQSCQYGNLGPNLSFFRCG